LAAGERALDRPVLIARFEAETKPAQLVDESAVVRVREPLGNRLGALRADPLALHDLLLRGGREPVDAAEMAREVLRSHPADVRDVQADEHTPERHRFRGL